MSSVNLPLMPMMPIALQTAGSQWISLLPMVAIFAIFYFLLVAPMRKRQRALQQLIEGLKKGDRVVTTGGLYGEIAAIGAGTVILKVADNVKLKFAKSAIAGLEGEADKGVKS
jgi:preprotein translocase subunit YajC